MQLVLHVLLAAMRMYRPASGPRTWYDETLIMMPYICTARALGILL